MEMGRHRGMMLNERIGSNSHEKFENLKDLGSSLTNPNSIHEEIQRNHKAGNSC